MTAAHCICSRRRTRTDTQPDPHPKSLCKPYRENQITPNFNHINVYGGHKDVDILKSSQNAKKSFSIASAFIKNDPFGGILFLGKDDIGLLIANKPLFDKDKMKNTKSLDRPPIVPICLSPKDADLDNEKIMGVGWGSLYDETRPNEDPNEDPHVSSCMTNEVAPIDWRFEACNMQIIKTNNWSCEKHEYPPETSNDIGLCKALFARLRRVLDQSQFEFMEKVDKMVIYHPNDPDRPFLTCYNEKLYKENGWCRVHGEIHVDAWGFCSPSCDENLMKVMSYNKFSHYSINLCDDNVAI